MPLPLRTALRHQVAFVNLAWKYAPLLLGRQHALTRLTTWTLNSQVLEDCIFECFLLSYIVQYDSDAIFHVQNLPAKSNKHLKLNMACC